MQAILNIINASLYPAITIAIGVILTFFNHWVYRKIDHRKQGMKIGKAITTLSIYFVTIVCFIIVLPIDEGLKGQALSLIGIVVSAGIALSSTNILGNLIAGIMNNSMSRFKVGDLIQIKEFHGRVIKKSVFHTEIQTEDSNFVTLPNLYISMHPVALIRKTKTVVSTSLTLGYDVDRKSVENSLLEAANECELSNPYVYITLLGNYSIEYKIHGFLSDSSIYFSTTSRLNALVIDTLHRNGIEIVSPKFINQRIIDKSPIVPVVNNECISPKIPAPEALIFAETNASEKIENKKETFQELERKKEKITESLKNAEDPKSRSQLEKKLQKIENIQVGLEKALDKNEQDLS
jgi:small conductance mechanosensitive channel